MFTPWNKQFPGVNIYVNSLESSSRVAIDIEEYDMEVKTKQENHINFRL